jgi:2-(1,2-epoxy-1,2-dihydrophenyl)acetyl-CoA isomerase
MTDIVKIADAGHVRTITLNRPEKKNALSNALAWGVIAAVEDAARTDEVWVIAITGSGDAFCSRLGFVRWRSLYAAVCTIGSAR